MKTQTRKNPIIVIATVSVLLAITSLACSTSRFRFGPSSTLVDITLTEDMFTEFPMPSAITMDGPYDNLLDIVTDIEIHDGFLRFVGSRHHVKGSFDLSISAEDDRLKASVIEVNLLGIELGDPIILEANEELADDLAHMVNTNEEVLFKEVVAEEGALRLKVQVNFDHLTSPSLTIRIP
jgi:hypothetical protein